MKKQILSLIAALTAAVLVSATAFAERTPDPNGQNKNNWCWVAASKMVAENNGGGWLSKKPRELTNTDGLHSYGGVPYYGENSNGEKTADGVQWQIVKQIKGSDKDWSGTEQDMNKALQFAAIQDTEVGRIGTERAILTNAQLADMRKEFEEFRYVVGIMRTSDYEHGHAVVITDYNNDDDTYKIYDPWDNTDLYYPSTVFSKFVFRVDNLRYRVEFYTYCRSTEAERKK